MKKKNILILYSSFGTGYKMAAIALEEKLKALYPGINVMLMDPFTYGKPLTNKILISISKFFTTKFKWLRYKYHKNKVSEDYSKKTTRHAFLARLFWNLKLEQKLKDFAPDIIFSTQASATNLIAFNKEKLNCKLISVLTDYGFSAATIILHDKVDYYCVPNKAIKRKMVALGVMPDKIYSIGVVLRDQFKETDFDKDVIFKRYHLSKQKPLYLFISGGGVGHESGFTYFEALLKSHLNFSYLLISGSNKKFEAKAKTLAVKYHKSGKVLGYVNNMAEIISACDLVIGKPGGILLSECLTLGAPFYSVEPIPGAEVWNSEFIRKNEFGNYAKNIKEFNSFLRKLHNKTISLKKIKRTILKEYENNTFEEFLKNIN